MGDLRRITERYRLDKLEGSSEGGSVFRGVDLETGRTVAVELIDRMGAEEPRERFAESARALQSLDHPGLPRVLDFGFTNAGSAFLVSEYLHGTPFADFAGAAPGRVLSLLLLVVDGLEALASRGMAHGGLVPESLLVTPGDEGEQVKILALGSVGPGPLDLRVFGRLACRMLRVQVEPEVGIPLEVAVELQDIEALRLFLDAASKGDPTGRYPTYAHARTALRRSLFGAGRGAEMRSETIVHPPDGMAEEAGTLPDLSELQTQVFPPPEEELEGEVPEEDLTPTQVIPPSELPAVPPAPVPVAARSLRKRLPLIAGLAAAALAAAVAFPLLLRSHPEAVEAPRPAPPSAVPAPVPASLPPSPRPPLVPEETAPVVTPNPAPEELAGRLSRALEKGDLRATGAAVAMAEGAAGLPADLEKNLARARRALAISSRLAQAQKGGDPLEVIRQAAALLQEVPRASRAAGQREKAAVTVEREADAAIEEGRFDAALDRLEGLRKVWPERSGLGERLDRVAAERRADQDLEALLAAAVRDEKAGKPLDALQRLAGARPNPRWSARFQETRQRLEIQAAELDRKPPELALRGTEPAYEKGKTGVAPLRVTDDAGVKAVEGWARAEGGAWVKVTVRHLNGADYALEVPPEVHRNRNVEFYAVATDASGHTGQLGSAESPRRMKRKGWIERVFGREKE